MSKNTKPAITVAIPTYNRDKVLIETIKDIFKQTEQNFELIIVDQSKERTKKYLDDIDNFTKDSRFRYFHVSPPSVTTARNFALKKSATPYVIFLDDDVKLKNNLIEVYLNTFKKLPNISAIGGRVLQEGYEIRDEILHFDKYMVSSGVHTSPKAGFTNAFPGGNCAIKVKDALSLGGFETRYRTNSFREESDMSIKMSRAGYKIYNQPKAELLHLAAPRGGNRVSGSIWDHLGTYINEIFFTIKYVDKENLCTALLTKYKLYCHQVRHFPAYRRRVLFIMGIFAAYYRLYYGKQRIAKEIR